MVAEAHRSCVRQYGRKEAIFGPTHSLALCDRHRSTHKKVFFRDVTFCGVEKKVVVLSS